MPTENPEKSHSKSGDDTWVHEIANWLLSIRPEAVPVNVMHIATRQTFDAFGSAMGAQQHPAAQSMLEVARSLGVSSEASLFFLPERSAAANAILYNGSLIRALDCNDIFFSNGPVGHPSDNVAVAFAVAERTGVTGIEFLSAIAICYELYWRVLRYSREFSNASQYHWDPTCASGIVASAMAGLLLRLSPEQLANAIAMGGAQSYTLRETRTGDISMLKASANAVVAHSAMLGALMASAGMTGPPRVLEGTHGMLAAFATHSYEQFHEELLRPIENWKIRDVTVKPFPAIGTSQGAISAALDLVKRHGIRAHDVAKLELRLADIPAARRQMGNPASLQPRTRETADHSLPFLVTVALQDGELGEAQFANDRWLDPETIAFMQMIVQTPAPELVSLTDRGYPAVISVETHDGRTLISEMLHVPGSPSNPLSDDELIEKVARIAPTGVSIDQLRGLADRVFALADAPNVFELAAQLPQFAVS